MYSSGFIVVKDAGCCTEKCLEAMDLAEMCMIRKSVQGTCSLHMASDRMRKKIKDYAEIFGHIMRKHALIMRKLHRIMRKFKQVIKLIIRPVQCIYMLTVNP